MSNRQDLFRLDSRHAAEVANLIRASFPASWLSMTIYSSPGIVNYLTKLMERCQIENHHYFYGIQGANENRVQAIAHFLAMDDTMHLNNIAVHPQAQGNGYAKRLLALWHNQSFDNGFRRLSLDVDLENRRAIEIYKRMGMDATENQFTILFDPKTESAVTSNCSLKGWEEAKSDLDRFGFAKLRLYIDQKTLIIGIQRPLLFRLPEQITGAAHFLSQEFPGCQILAKSPTPPIEPAWVLATQTLRMTKSYSSSSIPW